MRSPGQGERPHFEKLARLSQTAPDGFVFVQKKCTCGWVGEATLWHWDDPEGVTERIAWVCPECRQERTYVRQDAGQYQHQHKENRHEK